MTALNTPAQKRRMLPYVVEFVRFSTGFVVIIAVALLTLSLANGSF